MHAQADIEFDKLLKIVKSLPKDKLSKLKAEINKPSIDKRSREEFRNLLLSGPTFSKKQLADIAKTRKAINQWRTKSL